MQFDVVVVGGGIGGLVTAALLAARGVNVGLFERQSGVGGCCVNFEHHGYEFEPTYGLYSGWEPGGIFERIFSQLPVKPPEVEELSTSYSVRLPDRTDIIVSHEADAFYEQLRQAFPECAQSAVDFYRQLNSKSHVSDEVVAAHLNDCSERFRRFVDVQLQTFAQCPSDVCTFERAALALDPNRRFWKIKGGAQSLAGALCNSIKASGGSVRLNSPVLRLAYAADGTPNGIDLLSGERVVATRAIVSNLTVWDTFGKLVGLSRTPREVGKQLRELRGWGAYLLFLALDHSAAPDLPSDRIIALTDWQEAQTYDPETGQFSICVNAESGSDKIPVTVSMPVRAEDWFSFHEDPTAHESQDQATLESLWTRLHAAFPELGASVEVIESATPQTFYETTRRKFGMVGGHVPSTSPLDGLLRPFPNLFLVGDTASSSFGLAAVAHSAAQAANTVTGK
jgi:phytoene dehydrogenase-like protein